MAGYLAASGIDDAGGSVNLAWKATLPTTGGSLAQWELRSVLNSAYLGKLKYTHFVVKGTLARTWAPG